MKRLLNILGILVAVVVVLVAAVALAGMVLSERKANRNVAITVAPVQFVTDAAAIARGKYLFESRGCMECHAQDGHGADVVNDGSLYIHAPNITGGKGGVTSRYTAEDWVRTIRHGVKPDGKPARIMPSEDYNRLTD